jgi:hypothetical protein
MPVGVVPFATTSGVQNERQEASVQMNLPRRSTLKELSVSPLRFTSTVFPRLVLARLPAYDPPRGCTFGTDAGRRRNATSP